jgi:uncharacterized membrane protein YvbJ
MIVMFCPKCGKENPNTNQFCGSCGMRLPIAAQVQQSMDEQKGLQNNPRLIWYMGY